MKRTVLCLAAAATLVLLLCAMGSAGTTSRGGVTPADLPLNEHPSLVPTLDFTPGRDPGITVGQDKWAVLVGISDYQGSGSDLQFCDDDVRDCQNALVNKYGFPQANIQTLIDGQATQANILAAIDWLISVEGPNSTVVFFYSGHGSNANGDPDGDGETKDESIVPWELSRIYDGTLAQKFAQLESTHVWISFDSCFGGGMNDPGITGPNKIDAMACSETGYSYESDTVQNGYYTYLLVEEGMLQGQADSNHDGTVTVEEAFNYCKANIKKYSPQKPVMNDQFPGELNLGL